MKRFVFLSFFFGSYALASSVVDCYDFSGSYVAQCVSSSECSSGDGCKTKNEASNFEIEQTKCFSIKLKSEYAEGSSWSTELMPGVASYNQTKPKGKEAGLVLAYWLSRSVLKSLQKSIGLTAAGERSDVDKFKKISVDDSACVGGIKYESSSQKTLYKGELEKTVLSRKLSCSLCPA